MKKQIITSALALSLTFTLTFALTAQAAPQETATETAGETQTQQTTETATITDTAGADLTSTEANTDLPYVVLSEGDTATLQMPAYAKGSGSVYRDKTVIQDLSYRRIDSGTCYTYVFTRELKVSKADIKSLGSNAAVGCQFGAFDIYSGNTIGFGVDPEYDVLSAEESGVGVPVYLADVEVDGTVYTLSSYQIRTTAFVAGDDGYYHSITEEVVNVPKDYNGFALVTYGLTESEHKKAVEFDTYDSDNGYCANVYTQLSTFVDPSHIAYYRFP